MEDLLSPDEGIRKEALNSLNDEANSNVSLTVNKIPSLVSIIPKIEDHWTALQVSTLLRTVSEKIGNDYREYHDQVMNTIGSLLGKEMTEDTYWESVIMNLLSPIQQRLQSDHPFAISHLDTLFGIMNAGGNMKYSGSGPITTMAMQKPALLKDHVPAVFQAVKNGNDTLLSVLQQLYTYDKDCFRDNFSFVEELYHRDLNSKIQAINLMRVMAPDYPDLLSKDLLVDMGEELDNPSIGMLVMMIYDEIASKFPERLADLHQTIYENAKVNVNLLFYAQNTMSLIGRKVPELASTIMENMMNLLEVGNSIHKTKTLSEIRNLAEKDKTLVEPYLETIRSFEDVEEETIRDQAKAIIDFYEGRDLRTMADQIESNNKLIEAAATSTEDLMAYIDENISMLKDFISEITKKLPVPNSFDTKGRIRRTITLNFVCDEEGDRCLFPHDRPFATESKSWSKWLKIAFSGVKLGKCLILPFNIGDAGGAIKQAYSAYKQEDDEEFLKYISQPFLTSSEQDMLIEQLREAKYFDVFHYDAQTAGWKCTMCNL